MQKVLKRFNNARNEEIITAYLFLLPFIVLWMIWFFYPMLQSFIISFQKLNFIKPDETHFIGLDNYVRLFKDPYFYKALKNSVIMVLVVVPFQSIISLILAVALNGNIKCRGIFRTIYYSPYIISPIAVATVFMYFFVSDTGVTKFFALFGLDNVTWYADVKLALPFIAIMYVWQNVGFYMVNYLSGLQTIPAEMYEASEIDGANKIQIFHYITIPMLKPVTFLVVTYGMIQAFQLFDQIAAVSQRAGGLGSPAGATSTLVTFFYLQSFKYMEMGYGSAAAVTLFLLVLAVSLVQKKLLGEDS